MVLDSKSNLVKQQFLKKNKNLSLIGGDCNEASETVDPRPSPAIGSDYCNSPLASRLCTANTVACATPDGETKGSPPESQPQLRRYPLPRPAGRGIVSAPVSSPIL